MSNAKAYRAVLLTTYTDVFNKLNLGFHHLKKDQCSFYCYEMKSDNDMVEHVLTSDSVNHFATTFNNDEVTDEIIIVNDDYVGLQPFEVLANVDVLTGIHIVENEVGFVLNQNEEEDNVGHVEEGALDITENKGRPKKGRKQKHPGQTRSLRKERKNSNKFYISAKGV